jgi:general secretion pathway protein N
MINSPKNSPGGSPAKPRIGGAFLGLTALAALLAFEVLEGPFFVPEAPPSGQPQRALAATGALPVEAADLSAFGEIVARPLFSPTRRPPPVREQTATATVAQPETFALIGVIISTEGRMALLRTIATDEVQRAVEGQSVGGWEVGAINPTHVVLQRGKDKEVIKINDADPASGETSANAAVNQTGTPSTPIAPGSSEAPE